MLYPLARKILFQFDPETAHRFSLKTLRYLHKTRTLSLAKKLNTTPTTVMGLNFPNPVGLAAGLDSNGEYVDALAALGFGFIEIGGVTPRPQAGNPKPRLFRIPEHKGIINRMGFYNKGVEHMADALEKRRYRGILGINITKNKETDNEHAIDDYLTCIRTLHAYASYFTVNVSSPNTPGLRVLQKTEYLTPLLTALKLEQADLQQKYGRYIPLVVKLSPDLTAAEIEEVANVLLANQIDGVIATNTSINRDNIDKHPTAKQAGGMSGKPLTGRSTAVIRQLYGILGEKLPIIASGGVIDAAAAKEKMDAGAKLVQVYSGFIYQGPRIIRDIVTTCAG